MESYKKSFMLGDKEITLESGKVARQATGAVIATCEDTQVLATVVVGKAPGEHQDALHHGEGPRNGTRRRRSPFPLRR